ncbi:MAG: L-cystine transporter [Woeseiaceae bacterium]|nr:L-cystine transporter [Woeseiaceae bacterium]MDG1712950.1 L-cystine transporter [Woeseiaceae bacterium]MDG1865365.1 L-cystine transporter [Woeseiaceae bacterium]
MLGAILNIFVFALLILFIARQMQSGLTLSKQILLGLFLGVFFGLALQVIYSDQSLVIQETLVWTNVIGSSYVNLLRMVIMPLVLTMMIAAVVKMKDVASLGKVGFSVVLILLGTTMISALIGIGVSNLFGLTMDGLTEGVRELSRASSLTTRQESIASLGLADMLVRFIPSNIFSDLTGARPTSVIAVVIFGILFGIAALMVAKEDQEKAEPITSFIDTTQAIIMKLVRMIMLLTPYGILALMTKVVAGSDAGDILDLISFVLASYFAIFIMFMVHATLLRLNGVNVVQYFKNIWPVLTFAFTSRSSAATIPLNVETQVDKLKVPQSIANLSASLGATIGQNGCAGIYPAMLAAMIAPSMGVNPMDPMFILSLVMVVTISSFGIAGVGGGATFAALVVLPAMGFPVALVALLISIEPLIDMARTALNVNGSIMAGVITGRRVNVE